MKKSLLSLLFLLSFACAWAQGGLSDEAQISVLTAAPSDDEVYTVYGHTALRVRDAQKKLDVVFNYGIFDFSKPNFIYRFARGETDYRLAACKFQDYIIEYQMRGSEVTEQVLNLTGEEVQRLWRALVMNVQPENAVYRYNFFYDNCATRPIALVEKHVEGTVKYNDPPAPQTFRSLINHCTRNHPWLTFGCDLALGSPTDQLASAHEMLFLPLYLKDALGKATIVGTDGGERKLVSATNLLAEDAEDAEEGGGGLTPMLCATILFVLILLITFVEWKKKTYYRWVDCLLFASSGAAGVVLFFLCFVSVHPHVWPNWLVVWLHPLGLIAAVLSAVKKLGRAAYYYHFINFAALTLLLAGWCFIPQHMNMAFIPLVATLWLRSGYGIYRWRAHI